MKKIFTFIVLTFTSTLFLTSLASAQGVSSAGVQQGMGTFAGLINTFNSTIVKALGTLFLSGAVVAFFWGVAQFIWGMRSGKPEVLTNGKQFMIWALIGLFVMFSVYGIIRFAQSIVPGLDSNTITIPNVQFGGTGATAGGAGAIGSSDTMLTCSDGITKYSQANGPGSCPTELTCQDGVTKYYSNRDPVVVCPPMSNGGI